MNNKLTDEQIASARAALNEALAQGPWSSSNFLTLIGKKLQQIRDDFEHSVADIDPSQTGRALDLANECLLKRSEMTKIYVSLYATDGSNVQTWERIVTNLPKQMISRPVYANEEDIVTAIRNKANPLNEAYVSMYVNPKDILVQDSDKISMDKLGKPLLALKDKAINLDNLETLTHLTGVYDFKQGRLVKR
jgi:intracellular multiplication protein IcmQ